MLTTVDLKTFDQERPLPWQLVKVCDGVFWETGFYHFSDHHTYPHALHSEAENFSTEIEGYTGDAEWMPVNSPAGGNHGTI